LEQWWHAIMAWFLGGVCVLLLDIILIVSLALPNEIALCLAVALTGWLYFPLRQFLWDRFGYRQAPVIDDWLPEVLPLLMDGNDKRAWKISLQRVWHALEVRQAPGALSAPEIVDDGLTLKVPSIESQSEYHFQVHCANNGQRLFNRRDFQSFFSLQKLGLLTLQIAAARDVGAELERQRIRRDIHD